MGDPQTPSFISIQTRRPADDVDSAYDSAPETGTPSATHDISRVKYHVKHLESFVQTLQESASRAFPNRHRPFQRYAKVQALLLHWRSDDLFVLPELVDLEKCLREDYNFTTDIYRIPSENSHLELMLKVGDMIKKHESEDTLFVVYYGGHARIDESRQSTWCANRNPASPWLQWSAIQTLLERSRSDALILLDCCAGAASATFPNGQSITETISASSWDAIAPDPGRYSFTNALIEVLADWRNRAFSAAMLHAELLARLKHPRPIMINGKRFEARSTPVHFMMTSNHKAPSIEFSRIIPESRLPPSPPGEPAALRAQAPTSLLSDMPNHGGEAAGPTMDEPHVMISLALEDDQRLDLGDWEEWLANFPALAKHVKVQGVFRSHSTLLLLSLPVMVWDLLPEDPACSFIAFIRSENLIRRPQRTTDVPTLSARVHGDAIAGGSDADGELETGGDAGHETARDDASTFSGTTLNLGEDVSVLGRESGTPFWRRQSQSTIDSTVLEHVLPPHTGALLGATRTLKLARPTVRTLATMYDIHNGDENQRPGKPTIYSQAVSPRRIVPGTIQPSRIASQVAACLEDHFQRDPRPDSIVTHFLASALDAEPEAIDMWFYRRRQQQQILANLQNLRISYRPPKSGDGARMILPGHLHELFEIFSTKRVLVIDLRAPSHFERSHIHEAVSLRTPRSFVESATLDMMQETFIDDQSRRSFAKWAQTGCVVFYDRVVEFSWECPVADALYDKLCAEGWLGQCFILKGHYHEFSSSFAKYISGAKMTKEAKQYLDDLRQQPRPTPEQAQEAEGRYNDWLRRLANEDRLPTELIPSKKAERILAVNEHQRELETELAMRFPELCRAAKELQEPAPPAYPAGRGRGDGDNFDRKAPLVEPLSRGLAKLQQETRGSEPHWPPDDYEYEEIGMDEALKIDPVLQRAESKLPRDGGEAAGELAQKSRQPQDQGQTFWKRLRPGGK